MPKVLNDEAVARAFRKAGEAVRAGDPDTLAGRFSPRPAKPARSGTVAPPNSTTPVREPVSST